MGLEGGEAFFTYCLAGKGYHTVPCESNPDFTGISFLGSVVSTQGENVEVALEIDAGEAGGSSYPFAPATGNLMYCMPQSGTKVSLYLGNAEEPDGMIAGCIRTNGAACEGTNTPSRKGFRSEYGKGLDLFPDSMGLTGGDMGGLTLSDEKGLTLESAGCLMLHAKEGIRLEDETGISIKEVSDICAMAMKASTTNILINETLDMIGTGTALSGSIYQSFAPFDDAPVKGEFDYIQRRKDIDPDGVFDVVVHGSNKTVQIEINGKVMQVDHRFIGKMLNNSSQYNGQAIRLLSCNTGALDDGFAQNLANYLNVKVTAPTKYLWAYSNGIHLVAGGKYVNGKLVMNRVDKGIMKDFFPGGNIIKN